MAYTGSLHCDVFNSNCLPKDYYLGRPQFHTPWYVLALKGKSRTSDCAQNQKKCFLIIYADCVRYGSRSMPETKLCHFHGTACAPLLPPPPANPQDNLRSGRI